MSQHSELGLEQELTALLEHRATGLDESTPPIAQLLADGAAAAKSRRRARTWIALGVAAAVAALVGLPVLLPHADDRAAPPPATSQVPTTPTTLPYLFGKEVHFRDRTVTLDARPNSFISHGDTTIFRDSKTERWWRVWAKDGSVEEFGPAGGGNEIPWEGWLDVTLSADGHTLAVLTHPTQSSSRITVYDTDGQEEMAHVDIDVPWGNVTGGGDSIGIATVTNSGQVAYYRWDQTGTTWWIWAADMTRPTQIDTPIEMADGTRQPPDGAITKESGIVTFTPNGRVESSDVGLDPATSTWSPTGTFVASLGADGPLISPWQGDDDAAAVHPQDRVTVQQWLGFESDAYAIAAATVDNGPSLVRCSTETGSCVAIGDLPADWPRVMQWASSPPSNTATDTAPDDAPSEIPDTSIMSLNGTTLTFAGTTYDVGRHINVIRARNTILIGRWGKTITWRTIRDGRLVPLPYGQGDVPVLNPDGTRAVVLTHPTKQTSRITLYDTSTFAEIDHVDRDLPQTCCDGGSIQLLTMDSSGSVTWAEVTRGTPHYAWRPGRDPIQVPKAPGDPF